MSTKDPIPRIYFEALAANDLARVPYHEQVELWAPLGPNGLARPITGAEDVRSYLAGVTPLIEEVEILNLFENGEWQAGRAFLRMSHPKNALLRVFDVFKVQDGRIIYQENHYDPRAVLG
jgi:limonene-1,2-epoxide hydrolase